MTRVLMIDPVAASGRTRVLLDAVVGKRGRVSDMLRVMAIP